MDYLHYNPYSKTRDYNNQNVIYEKLANMTPKQFKQIIRMRAATSDSKIVTSKRREEENYLVDYFQNSVWYYPNQSCLNIKLSFQKIKL